MFTGICIAFGCVDAVPAIGVGTACGGFAACGTVVWDCTDGAAEGTAGCGVAVAGSGFVASFVAPGVEHGQAHLQLQSGCSAWRLEGKRTTIATATIKKENGFISPPVS
jgi:hypothetical protein